MSGKHFPDVQGVILSDDGTFIISNKKKVGLTSYSQ